MVVVLFYLISLIRKSYLKEKTEKSFLENLFVKIGKKQESEKLAMRRFKINQLFRIMLAINLLNHSIFISNMTENILTY